MPEACFQSISILELEALKACFDRVCQGQTAFGRESAYQPLRFPNNPRKRSAVVRAVLNVLLLNLKCRKHMSDRFLTVLFRKTALYAVRTLNDEPSYFQLAGMSSDVSRALNIVPELLYSRAGYAAMAAKGRMLLEAAMRRPYDKVDFTSYRAAKGIPNRPVVWSAGKYRLEQAISSLDVWELGHILGNCLLTMPTGAPVYPGDAASLPYWRAVDAGQIALYALRSRKKYLALICAAGRSELQLYAQMTTELDHVLLDALGFLEGRHGKLSFYRHNLKRSLAADLIDSWRCERAQAELATAQQELFSVRRSQQSDGEG